MGNISRPISFAESPRPFPVCYDSPGGFEWGIERNGYRRFVGAAGGVMELKMGNQLFLVSLLSVIQATGLLTFAPVGLTPTGYTSLLLDAPMLVDAARLLALLCWEILFLGAKPYFS